MAARQKIHAGMIHAGKTATVICENSHFQVIIGGETAVVVPRTTTSEIHRYQASASQHSLAGPLPAKTVTSVPDSGQPGRIRADPASDCLILGAKQGAQPRDADG
jgi:hypothetical protein